MTMVQQAIEIEAPLHAVYEQLTTLENYPRFMTGVAEVTPIGQDRTHWVMDFDGMVREFDAQITELTSDKRVSWATVNGPQLTETITVRPVGETRTQVVAQMDADVSFLMPRDRHGHETLNRRLKDDLTTFKGLIESGRIGVSSKRLSTRTASGSAPMGGLTSLKDAWGDGMINEEDRGSAYDFRRKWDKSGG